MKTLYRLVTVLVVPFLLSGCLAIFSGTAGGAAGVANAEDEANRINVTDTMIGAAVLVQLTQPKDLAAVRSKVEQHETVQVAGAPGDSLYVRSVASVIGRIEAQNSDAMLIRVTETNGTAGKKAFGGKYVIVLPRDSNANVQVLSRRPSLPHGMLLASLVFAVVSTYKALRAMGGS